MFFELKRKYIESCAKSFIKKAKQTREKKFVNWNDVKSVVLLLDAEHINHAKLSKLYQMVSDKKAKIWCMIPKYDPRTGDSENVYFFDTKSISFLEKPNNIITGKFVSVSYDVLIDLKGRSRCRLSIWRQSLPPIVSVGWISLFTISMICGCPCRATRRRNNYWNKYYFTLRQ